MRHLFWKVLTDHLQGPCSKVFVELQKFGLSDCACGCIYNCRAVVLLQMSWSKCVTCLKLDSSWTGKNLLLPRKTFIWMWIVKGTEVLSTGRTFTWENGFNCHHYGKKNPHGGSIRISWLWNASYKWFWQMMRSIYNVWKIYIDFK